MNKNEANGENEDEWNKVGVRLCPRCHGIVRPWASRAGEPNICYCGGETYVVPEKRIVDKSELLLLATCGNRIWGALAEEFQCGVPYGN